MENNIKSRIAKLIDVKSIVTLAMTVGLVVLLFTTHEPTKEVLTLYCTSYGAIIAYFFTKNTNNTENK